MGFGSIGGGSSIGAAIGKAAGKAVPKGTGKSTARVTGGSSSRRSKSPVNRSSGRSSGGGSSSRSSGGSSGGGGGTRYSVPKTPKAPSAPSLASWLGNDAAYQQVVSGGKRSLADFLSEMSRRRGEAGTQYTQTTQSMERDRVQQLADLQNEYASRGLIQSGLYGEEQGKFQEQFTTQKNALAQQQAALLADLMSQQKNYQREQDLSLKSAQQDALARRAAKYKITG
jgi:hypothetical protein